ncbi:ferritin [Spirochaetia bacterium 38H-sp]|uniref:Ferritin n=1 Tax=Rarispira pelagica TaxID=3141764 RepID=A0ABU9UAF1_9SPIR
MISERLLKELNVQIREELASYYLYLSMSSYFADKNLNGFAGWMYNQAQEEMAHAMKIYGFIIERGGRAIFDALDRPKSDWTDVKAVFEDTLKHEQYITGRINKLVSIAREENDYATEIFLQWFVTEQIEEEANAEDILNKISLLANSPQALYLLDKELGARGSLPLASGQGAVGSQQ